MSKAPYDERNQADYLAISNNIEVALNLIAADLTIPATEMSLAELAGCSRGTLRNRIYPLERLKAIKSLRAERRKASKRSVCITPAHQVTAEVQVDEKRRLQEQLHKSRSETAVWVKKHSDLEREVKHLNRLKDVLLQGKKLLEEKVEELKGLLQEKDTLTADEKEKKLFLVKT